MLYELYKKNYFNLCDNLIIRLLHFSLILIFKFFKLFFKNVRFTSIRCALCARLQEAFALKCAPHFYQHWVLLVKGESKRLFFRKLSYVIPKKKRSNLGYSIVCYAGNHWVCVTLSGIPRRDGWQYQVLNDKKIS